jgi:hypothetical protein
VREIAGRLPAVQALLDEHVKDNLGDILPHVFLGNLTRYILSLLPGADAGLSADRSLRELLDHLEASFESGGPEVQELIVVSFLENLPASSEVGSEIREMMGPNLSRELKQIG